MERLVDWREKMWNDKLHILAACAFAELEYTYDKGKGRTGIDSIDQRETLGDELVNSKDQKENSKNQMTEDMDMDEGKEIDCIEECIGDVCEKEPQPVADINTNMEDQHQVSLSVRDAVELVRAELCPVFLAEDPLKSFPVSIQHLAHQLILRLQSAPIDNRTPDFEAEISFLLSANNLDMKSNAPRVQSPPLSFQPPPTDIPPQNAMTNMLSLFYKADFGCHLCLNTLTDPITTPCGHTWCRSCLLTSMDHSKKCPMCRDSLPSYGYIQNRPASLAVESLIAFKNTLSGESLSRSPEPMIKGEELMAVFICSLALPGSSHRFHIFEPKYRVFYI